MERPFRNFLDLILFPKSSIFKKQKDLEDSDDSTESDDGKPQVVCGFCNDEPCDCECLITKKKCKCADKPRQKPVEDSVLESNLRSMVTTRTEQQKKIVSFNFDDQ